MVEVGIGGETGALVAGVLGSNIIEMIGIIQIIDHIDIDPKSTAKPPNSLKIRTSKSQPSSKNRHPNTPIKLHKSPISPNN